MMPTTTVFGLQTNLVYLNEEEIFQITAFQSTERREELTLEA